MWSNHLQQAEKEFLFTILNIISNFNTIMQLNTVILQQQHGYSII